ncbi:hypothetical protein [Cognatilysobacter lacus]|uniref:Uncharacterized protein n=1 Tax=Cognatilysobacter lacus TaxID=1643323 RepID=A0A5D8YCT9_9GAMM|nr:hypothetical protein [Lysobacter lacus]TZF79653.1 hypothetical protein FW784_14180 [Lysobacter lacus]
MQTALNAAAVLAVLTGLVHSTLGEWLIFRHLRQGTFVPQLGAPPLRARNIRILWATWHLASVFGWAFAAILFSLANSPEAPLRQRVLQAAVAANAGGAILVLVGTRGRHPGWVALGAVAICAWVALGGA